jgi:hypothetical protein
MSSITETSDPGAGLKTPREKHVSERQLAANRANARKNTGPKTPEGKAVSRFNGLKHGLCAANVCLPGDDTLEYERDRQDYLDYYRPANRVEFDLVEDIFAARWRKKRSIRTEKNLVLDSFVRARIDMDKHYAEISLDAEIDLAARDLADESSSPRLLDRYEARMQRNIASATKLLQDAQRNRPPVPAAPLPDSESDPVPQPAAAGEKLPTETIPKIEHPASVPDSDFTPIGNATRTNTIVLKPRPVPPKPPALAAAATASSPFEPGDTLRPALASALPAELPLAVDH